MNKQEIQDLLDERLAEIRMKDEQIRSLQQKHSMDIAACAVYDRVIDMLLNKLKAS